MKHLIFIPFCCLVLPATATGPNTSCPSGYTTITEPPTITIATSCQSGTTSAGTITSCLDSNPSFVCYMFAPVGISFTDDSGTYEFTDVCPME
ncbi:MAG: hypothetical protein E7009_00970 [Alphaproteobacteria bacterium]|nr:hypothetical protein [Alphaproteobacteria bacterium]